MTPAAPRGGWLGLRRSYPIGQRCRVLIVVLHHTSLPLFQSCETNLQYRCFEGSGALDSRVAFQFSN